MRNAMTMNEVAKTIRTGLKKLCKTLSVRRGNGTAYSWIEIRGSGDFGRFTDAEKAAIESIKMNRGGNYSVIAPEDQDYWMMILANSQSILPKN